MDSSIRGLSSSFRGGDEMEVDDSEQLILKEKITSLETEVNLLKETIQKWESKSKNSEKLQEAQKKRVLELEQIIEQQAVKETKYMLEIKNFEQKITEVQVPLENELVETKSELKCIKTTAEGLETSLENYSQVIGEERRLKNQLKTKCDGLETNLKEITEKLKEAEDKNRKFATFACHLEAITNFPCENEDPSKSLGMLSAHIKNLLKDNEADLARKKLATNLIQNIINWDNDKVPSTSIPDISSFILPQSSQGIPADSNGLTDNSTSTPQVLETPLNLSTELEDNLQFPSPSAPPPASNPTPAPNMENMLLNELGLNSPFPPYGPGASPNNNDTVPPNIGNITSTAEDSESVDDDIEFLCSVIRSQPNNIEPMEEEEPNVGVNTGTPPPPTANKSYMKEHMKNIHTITDFDVKDVGTKTPSATVADIPNADAINILNSFSLQSASNVLSRDMTPGTSRGTNPSVAASASTSTSTSLRSNAPTSSGMRLVVVRSDPPRETVVGAPRNPGSGELGGAAWASSSNMSGGTIYSGQENAHSASSNLYVVLDAVIDQDCSSDVRIN